MATKKQKRAAGEAKHKAFMEEVRRSGLEAQKKDRERRERQRLDALESRDRRVENQRKESLKAVNDMKREDAVRDDSSLEMECI